MQTDVKFCFVIVTSLYSLSESPNESNPGPKFALVAGVSIFKFSPKLHL